MAKKTNILVARVSYELVLDGNRLLVHRGKTTAHANHPVVRGNEDKWRSLTVDYAVDENVQEEVPAPPKRGPGRPKKQAEAKQEVIAIEEPTTENEGGE